jgi:hypothetical protein
MNRTILLFITASVFSISLAGCGETGSMQSKGVTVSQIDQNSAGKEADAELSEHEQLNAYLADVFADNLSRQPLPLAIWVSRIVTVSGILSRKHLTMKSACVWSKGYLI